MRIPHKNKGVRFVYILAVLFLCITLTIPVLAVNPNGYQNGSTPTNMSTSKLINYIQANKTGVTGTKFCIGRDRISYFMRFLDEERDYQDLPMWQHITSNLNLLESQKKPDVNSVTVTYTHDPTVYDNPVSKSALSGNTYKIGVTWDAAKNRWKLTDASSAILFEQLSDDKRGQWSITVGANDYTGKPLFDKTGYGTANFWVHKPPVATVTESTSGGYLVLSGVNSYDIDYQYSKNSRVNAANNRMWNGIKEFTWMVKYNNAWHGPYYGTSVSISTSYAVTDYSLTVEDYDGAFTTFTKSMPPVEKPLVDFNFSIQSYNGPLVNYVYAGNVGKESTYVSPLISWNDAAYNATSYPTSGTRTEKWTDLRTGQTQASNTLFTTQVLQGNITNTVGYIDVELEAKNKFDYFATKQKRLMVYGLGVNNLTSGQVYDSHVCTTNPCGFEVGTRIKYILQQTNPSVNNDEIRVTLTAAPYANTLELVQNGNQFSVEEWVPSSTTFYDKYDYTFRIYSKRTGELLQQQTYTAYLHTPLNLIGYLNSSRDMQEINADEDFTLTATTTEFAKTVVANLRLNSTNQIFRSIPLTPNANHTSWSATTKITASELPTDQDMTVEFVATAYNNRDIEYDYIGFKYMTYKLENFRVVNIRDLRLKDYYTQNGKVVDRAMNVNSMGIDALSFYPYAISSLAKGYIFDFEIDSTNFNEDMDTIVFTPSFYAMTPGSSYRDPVEKDAFWIDSNKKVFKVGQGSHSSYNTIVLTKVNRTTTSSNKATWRGSYYIPATTFLAPKGTSVSGALNSSLNSDILVNFSIKGYKNGVLRYDYNARQWGIERTNPKAPYQIGDVIRYGQETNLGDLEVIRPR